MADLHYIDKLYKFEELSDGFDSEKNSLEAAFTLIKTLLIFPNSQQRSLSDLYKLKRFNKDAFKFSLARIFASPFIAAGLAVLFTINAAFSFLEGVGNLLFGKFRDAYDDIVIQTIGSIIGVAYAVLLIAGAPLLNTTQFLVRAIYTLLHPSVQSSGDASFSSFRQSRARDENHYDIDSLTPIAEPHSTATGETEHGSDAHHAAFQHDDLTACVSTASRFGFTGSTTIGNDPVPDNSRAWSPTLFMPTTDLLPGPTAKSTNLGNGTDEPSIFTP